MSSSWYDVATDFATGARTQARPPQFIHDNVSSTQVADASADNDTIGHTINNNPNTAQGYRIDHKPPSNISTETPSTDDTATVTDLFHHHHIAALNNNNNNNHPSLGPTPYTFRAAAHPPLTTTSLALHQRELEQFHTSNLAGWIEGAGIGSRFATEGNNHKHPSSVAHTLLTVATAGCHGHCHSVAGSSSPFIGGGGDCWTVVAPPPPPTRTDEDLVAAGAWCACGDNGGMPMPPMRKGSVMSVSVEEGGY